jgi:SAM-dependent methyltransferase
VVTGVADEAVLGRLGAMDVIVLLDVIEHLPSPRDTLALCARHLNPGGIIVITTGDFGSLYARLAGAHWRLMTPPQHLWFFSRESMRRIAASLALEVELFDHPWKIVPLSLITFQLGRMLGRKTGGAPVASRVGLPVNLFDAMRIVLRKPKPAAEPRS